MQKVSQTSTFLFLVSLRLPNLLPQICCLPFKTKTCIGFFIFVLPPYIQVFLEWDVSEMFITYVKRTLFSAIVSFQEAALKIRAKHLRYFLYWSLQSSPLVAFENSSRKAEYTHSIH